MTQDGKTVRDQIHTYVSERAPLLMLLLSPDGQVLECNRYVQSLTGEDPVGRSVRDLIIDFSGSFDLSNLLEDATQEHLLNINTAGGLPQSFYFTFTAVADGVLVFGRQDAEELENMRMEVLSLNREMSSLTRELYKTNDQLNKLNEEKNRFLGMAAHDLRKPIGLIISYSEFLIDEAQSVLNREHIGFLNTINASCAFMKRLVDDFLDVSAIEAGKFDLNLHPASIVEVLDIGLRLNSLQAQKKGIVLERRCAEGIPLLLMDAAKIEQAITNLVSNAIEHSDPGSPVIVSLSMEPDQVVFSVQDSGPGIPPEEMDRIFKPFAKTGARKTGGEKSTGLGMVISRKNIETHGGQIRLKSTVGTGTTVSFSLPLTDKRQ